MTRMLLQGCNSVEKDPQLLIVERQSLTFNLGDSTTENRRITYEVDVPVAGPKFLADSVMSLLNELLHENCEILLDSPRKTLDEVRTDDRNHFLQHYADIYEPYLKEEYSGYYDLTVEMLAQNTSFITYGVGVLHCGASCGSEMYCYTLSKKDGHRLSEIMTVDNYKHFLEESADYSDSDDEMDEVRYNVSDSTFQFNSFGLLGHSVLIVSNAVTNHCRIGEVDYDDIKPYLTEEARQLMEKASADKTYPKNDWYVGKRLGEMMTESGKTFFLREYNPFTETYFT